MKLKRCPFCGGKPKAVKATKDHRGFWYASKVGCENCTVGFACLVGSSPLLALRAAAKLWNTRRRTKAKP